MRMGPITLDAPMMQAGLAGYSDRAMRLVARRRGCPYAVTEAILDRTLLAMIRRLRFRKKLKRIYPEAGFSLATIMAAFISLLGIPALIAVILQQ